MDMYSKEALIYPFSCAVLLIFPYCTMLHNQTLDLFILTPIHQYNVYINNDSIYLLTLNYMFCLCFGSVSLQNEDPLMESIKGRCISNMPRSSDTLEPTSPLPIPKEEEKSHLQEFLWLPSVAPGEVDIPAGCFFALTR